ncbi:MAG TPA: hypothetical protein VK762_20460 [Polyangiaceae bacterium]|nr:hypothetical protein [Polyangiaceae bacterium]
MELPPIRRRSPFLTAAACLVGAGCGSSAGSASPSPSSPDALDASTADVVTDDATIATEAAPGDTPDAGADDADDCTGVRCAPPPPCDQPCTTACCCDRSCPPAEPEGGTQAPPDAAADHDAGASCAGAGDCRLFSDMCGACTCLALAAAAADPVCPGPGVSCFRDPCTGQSAACVAGQCAAVGP